MTLAERYKLIEDVKALANYVVSGEGWRVRAIELQVTKLHKSMALLEEQLYLARTRRKDASSYLNQGEHNYEGD